MTRRIVALLSVTLCLAPAFAEEAAPEAPPLAIADLKGLWAGTVEHLGESSPFALDLEPGVDGKVQVKASIPVIHLSGVPLGRLPVEINGEEVRLGSFVLTYDGATGTLRGTLPESLAPVHNLPVTLRRTGEVRRLPRVRPRAPIATPLWKYQAGAQLWPGVTAAGDLLLAGADDGHLHALDARTGKRRWTFRAGGAIRTRAVVADGVAYLQADDGLLYALSTSTGSELWRARVVEKPVTRKPPSDPTSRYDRFGSDVTPAGDRLYLGTHDGRLLCLDAKSGARIWDFQAADSVVAAPAVAAGRATFGSFDGHVYALDATTGSLVWKHNTHKPVVSTPAVAGERVVVGSRSYDLFALDAATGAVAWQRYFWFSWVESSVVVRDGVAYVGSSDAAALLAFDVDSGRSVWRADVWGWAWGRPAVTERRVVIGTAGMKGYPAPHRGAVMALDRATGRVVWQFLVEPKGNGTFGFPGAVDAEGGRVFAAGIDGRIYAFAE